MSPIPAWLQRQLETTTGAPLNARATTTRHCPNNCGAIVLTALDDHTCALLVNVDPAPIDATTELAATLAGRDTYRAWPRPNHDGRTRFELQHRDQWSIRTPPGPGVIVLPAHVCHQPLPTVGWPTTATATTGASDEPPY